MFNHFPPITHHLAATAADNFVARGAGQITIINFHLDLLNPKKHAVGHASVSIQLPTGFIGDSRRIGIHQTAGLFGGDHPEGLAGFKVHKSGGHDAVVLEFQRAPPQFDTGHMGHRISGATVHLHIDDQLFDLIVTPGLIEPDKPAAQHGHAYAYHLPGAKMAVDRG